MAHHAGSYYRAEKHHRTDDDRGLSSRVGGGVPRPSGCAGCGVGWGAPLSRHYDSWCWLYLAPRGSACAGGVGGAGGTSVGPVVARRGGISSWGRQAVGTGGAWGKRRLGTALRRQRRHPSGVGTWVPRPLPSLRRACLRLGGAPVATTPVGGLGRQKRRTGHGTSRAAGVSLRTRPSTRCSRSPAMRRRAAPRWASPGPVVD